MARRWLVDCVMGNGRADRQQISFARRRADVAVKKFESEDAFEEHKKTRLEEKSASGTQMGFAAGLMLMCREK